MPKVVLTPIVSGFSTVTQQNANLAAITAAIENTLSRDGTAPNTMTAPIDMNSQSIINLPDAVNPGDPVTFRQYEAAASPSAAAAAVSAGEALVSQNAASASAALALASETNAAASAVASAASAVTSTNAAALALSYTASGFGGTLLDLGFVTDATIYFPTDLGVLP